MFIEASRPNLTFSQKIEIYVDTELPFDVLEILNLYFLDDEDARYFAGHVI